MGRSSTAAGRGNGGWIVTDARGRDIAVTPLGPEFRTAVVIRSQSIERHSESNAVSLPSLEMLVCSLPFNRLHRLWRGRKIIFDASCFEAYAFRV